MNNTFLLLFGALFSCSQAWCLECSALMFMIHNIPRIFFIPRAWCPERNALICTILTIRATRLRTNRLVPRTCNRLLSCTPLPIICPCWLSTLVDRPPSIPWLLVHHVLYHHTLWHHHLLFVVIHHVISSSLFSSISQSSNTWSLLFSYVCTLRWNHSQRVKKMSVFLLSLTHLNKSVAYTLCSFPAFILTLLCRL